MKKLNLFLLLAFLASFPLNFVSATQYCGETITATNNKTAILTCTNPSANTYVMEITSTEAGFTGLRGTNMWCHINGTEGYQMTKNYTFKDGKVTFTITSTTVPKMYTPLYLNINNAECEFKTIQNQTFEWPTSCSGGGPVTGVTLDKTGATLKEGRTLTLKATIAPANAGNKNVSWSSDDTNVATVTDGVVTAKAVGTANISVTTEDGSFKATCVITVIAGNPDEVEITSGTHTIVYTAYWVEDNTYELTLTSEEDLKDLSSGCYWHVNGTANEQMKNKIVTDSDPKKIVVRTTSTSAPQMYTSLYVMMSGEVTFAKPTFTWIDKRAVPGGDEPDCPEFTASVDSANAHLSADGNLGTRWGSNSGDGDDVFWQHKYATAQTFNRVKIVWEGAWGKSFDILAGNDCANLTKIAEVRDQTLSGFPYTQVIELEATVTANTIRFEGVKRGTGYGYSFWELEVYQQQTPVLTTFEFSASADLCKVGETVNLTATPKDQYGVVMTGQTITYAVSPDTAGHVADGKYYADAFGEATITATCGSMNKSVKIFSYMGTNLAESTNVSTNNKIVSHSNQGQDGYVAGSAKDAYFAVDNSDNTLWEGKMGGNTGDDEASRTYDSWFVVDLGANYDINCVLIKFEGACSQNYTLDFSADNESWVNGYTYSGNYGTNDHTDKIYEGSSQNLQNNDNVRYVRFWSTKAATQYNMKIYYFKVYGTEAASATKNVSATVNDAKMGSAVVKQNNVAVTQVEVGTNADFIATENDGYLFLGWYQGENKVSSSKTYTVENIQSNTTLQAKFRALNTIYCHTALVSGDHTIYLTMKRTTENTYQVVIDCAEEMAGFSNAYIGGINGNGQIKLNDADVMAQNVTLSADKHRLTIDVTSTTPIRWNTPVYINMPGEVVFSDPNQKTIEYDVPCEEVAVESVTVSPSSATIDVEGNTTLVAVASPIYATDKSITWTTSDATTATIADGLVTGVKEGSATITATIGGKSANCSITVQLDPSVPHVAAPAVVSTGKEIRSVYSDALTSALTSEFSLNTYGTAPCEKKVVAGDNLILCSATTGNVVVSWGREANVAGAFIAKSGMNDGTHTGLDASGMKYLHIDLWSSAAASNVNIQNDNTVIASVNLDGSGWQSFDLDITSTASTLNNISIMKYTNLPTNTKVAIDNVYFWKSAGTAAVESVSLSQTSATIDKDWTLTLTALVTPLAASQNVTWESSNTSIATVSNGVVTAVAIGEAVITAKSEADPTKLATCSVNVVAPTEKVCWNAGADQGIALSYSMTYGTDKKVTIFMQPIHTKTDFVMEINDGDFHSTTAVENGYTYCDNQIHQPGTTMTGYFWMKFAGGVGRVDYSYTVGDVCEKPAIAVTGITINKANTTIKTGESEQLSAHVEPLNADNQNFSWSSDNESVATVSATGLVSAIAAGTANIIATSEDGGKKDTCVVTVVAELTAATYYFTGYDGNYLVSIRASITRNDDKTLTYRVVPTHDKEGFVLQINDGAWHDATLNEGVYTWTSTATYLDGVSFNGFVYMPFAGGAARVDFTYTVGTVNEEKLPMLSLKENESNTKVLNTYSTQEVDVTLNRTFVADGYWYTLCLPFSLTAEQLAAAYGADYDLRYLKSSYMKSDDLMYLNFVKATELEAGMPYMFKPTGTSNENYGAKTFTSVVVDNKTPENETEVATMTGYYSPMVIDAANYALGTDDYLYHTDGEESNAFRCYFTLNPPTSAPVQARCVFNDSHISTEVQNAECTMHNEGKMLINGRLIIIRDGRSYNAQGQIVK